MKILRNQDISVKFLSYLREHHSPDEKIIIVGDFNVAVEDRDVYDAEVDLWPRRRRTPTPSDHTSVIGIFDEY